MEARLTLAQNERGYDIAGWLTVERAAYGALGLLAVCTRLIGLGTQPLSPDEALQALPAFAAAAGQPYQVSGISPLLFSLQRAFFTAFPADALLARWWPAVLGGLAVLFFYALRDRLGRGGALAAALLWAFSPLAVFTARLGLGNSLVPPLALALLASLNRYAAKSHRAAQPADDDTSDGAGQPTSRWLVAAAGIAGLLLISGADAYTVVLVGVVAVLWWRTELPALWAGIRASWRGVVAAGLGAFAFGATLFMLTPNGLAAAADLLGSWLSGLAPLPAGYSGWEIVRRLLQSEPLLVGFGIGGFVMVLRQRDRFGTFMGIAVVVALLLAAAPRSRNPVDLGLVVLALALLAGPAVAAAVRPVSSWRDQVDPWLLSALELILLGIAAQSLPSALNGTNTADWRQLYTTIGAITFGLAALLWAIYGAFGSWRTTGEVLPVVLLIVGLVWGLSQLAGLSFDHGIGREPGVLTLTADAGGLADLHGELRELAALKGEGANEARVDIVLPLVENRNLVPVLHWELLRLPNLRVLNAWPADPAPIVLTIADKSAAPGGTYGGAAFNVLQRWRPDSLKDAGQWVRWLLYREMSVPPDRQQVVLWVDRAAPTKP